MTVTEQVKSLSRDIEGLRSNEQTAAHDEFVRRLSLFFKGLHSLKENAVTIYNAASVLTPQFESSELALEVWEDLHKNLTFVLAMLDPDRRLPKVQPIDDLIDEVRTVYGDLAKKSEKEILDWTAKVEASSVPNAETVAAMEAAMRGEVVSFDSVANLMADLNAED